MYIERGMGRQQKSICAKRRSYFTNLWCFMNENRLAMNIGCMLIFGWKLCKKMCVLYVHKYSTYNQTFIYFSQHQNAIFNTVLIIMVSVWKTELLFKMKWNMLSDVCGPQVSSLSWVSPAGEHSPNGVCWAYGRSLEDAWQSSVQVCSLHVPSLPALCSGETSCWQTSRETTICPHS